MGLVGLIYTELVKNSVENSGYMYSAGITYLVMGLILLLYFIKLSKNKKKSDEQENIEIVLFPKNYIEIQKHDILYLKAKVEKRFDKYQLNVYKIVETIR